MYPHKYATPSFIKHLEKLRMQAIDDEWHKYRHANTAKGACARVCLSHEHTCMHARAHATTLTQLLFIYLNRCSGLSQVHSLNACHYCWRTCVYVAAKRVCVCVRVLMEKTEGGMKWMQSEDKRKNQQRAGDMAGRKRDGQREGNSLRRWGCRQKDGSWSPLFSVSTDSTHVCVININIH